MGLEERVAELERRLAALERHAAGSGADPDRDGRGRAAQPADPDFWALEGLKDRLAKAGADAGAVLFTGSVRLPTHERYDWQYGLPVEAILDDPENWSAASESLAALGHPVRMRLLREILAGRRTVAELTELEGIGTTGQAYHHLRQLSAAGWLHSPGRGRYEVPPGRVVPLLVVLVAARA
ncbi:ArsR/SmtB family transcription factor [Plantactinospora sp. CA-290183]|uniref:ArsR/SmtB family transcription factor n=1 Tax=Plantactinospora sp. CA-290183 TaxID=3240006 RepID=UPI003D938C1D